MKGFDVQMFAPSAPVGMAILFAGILFSGLIFYIFLTLNNDSESDKNKKIKAEKERNERIQRLYPSKNNIKS